MRAIKTIVYSVLLLLLVAAGWLMRGMLPSGPPGGGMRPGGPGGPPGMGGPPEVVTAKVKKTSTTPPLEYVGHVEAIQEADLYAQVQGTIQAVHFNEGGMVKKGDLLFTIDPERYEAQVELSNASVAQAKSNLTGAQADLEAAQANLKSAQANLDYAVQYQKRLAGADARSVVQADVDKAQSDVERGQAAVQQAKAQISQKHAQIQQFEAQVQQAQADLKLAKINLGYTQVRSPIDGRIGKAEVTAGDYVSPGNGLLARVVQVSPVRVQFAMSDRDYLNLAKANAKGELTGVQARLQLSNGDAFPEAGKVDFVSNLMDPATATIAVRFRFDNKARLLVPNSFVTVMMDQASSKNSLVVPQEAVMTDPNGEYVYVVNSAGVVERRPVKLGDQIDGNRIVHSGLKAGESVIVQGLQKARPGSPVKVAQTGGSARHEGA